MTSACAHHQLDEFDFNQVFSQALRLWKLLGYICTIQPEEEVQREDDGEQTPSEGEYYPVMLLLGVDWMVRIVLGIVLFGTFRWNVLVIRHGAAGWRWPGRPVLHNFLIALVTYEQKKNNMLFLYVNKI